MTRGQLAAIYHRVRRKPREGTMNDAIRCHTQACGVVSYVFDCHPDEVARAVRGDG